jgi:hypothetical protein
MPLTEEMSNVAGLYFNIMIVILYEYIHKEAQDEAAAIARD